LIERILKTLDVSMFKLGSDTPSYKRATDDRRIIEMLSVRKKKWYFDS